MLPFTLGVGFLSSAFGALADKIGARTMLVAGPLGAALAFLWMALTTESSLTLGVLGPMALLGLSFAVLITPLTATVMSSVEENDEGLASGVNNTASRVAQLAGIALAAGLASFGPATRSPSCSPRSFRRRRPRQPQRLCRRRSSRNAQRKA